HASRYVDLLDHGLSIGKRDDLFIGKRGGQHRFLISICWHGDAGLDLAHDLDWNLNLIVLEPLLIKSWEVNEGDGVLVAELVPQLLRDVRRNRRSHDQRWLNCGTWNTLAVVLGEIVGVLNQLRHSSIRAYVVVVITNTGDGAVQ